LEEGGKMHALPVEFKDKVSKPRSLVFFFMIILVLTACSSSSSAPTSQPAGLSPETALQPEAGSQPPVILRVVDREETVEGFLYVYQDIYFIDPDGDAVAMTYQEIFSSLSYPMLLPDEAIVASAEEQKEEVLATVGGKCGQKMELVFESRIRDRAGNLSEPVTFRISCTTPPVVDTASTLIRGLIIAIPIALLLLLGFWLLFRKQPEERLPAIRSLLFLFCLFLFMQFAGMILHEGGHALYLVVRGLPFSLYVHPFIFPGYARPVIDTSIWKDILGSLTSLTISLLVFLPLWKRRSLALLPLVMLFPYQAIYDGRNVLGWLGGDFQNLIQTNGLSPIPFIIVGILIILAGMFFLFGGLPLLGLDPGDKKTLFVLPTAMFLASALSLGVACLVVPGSPIDREYFLGLEIVTIARMILPIQSISWLVLAVFYATTYKWLYPKLPTWLRSETVQLEWKDLRIPAILATVSIILGLIIIT